jgi:hypothetical protein
MVNIQIFMVYKNVISHIIFVLFCIHRGKCDMTVRKRTIPLNGFWSLYTCAMYCCALNWCMAMDLRKVIDIWHIVYDRGGQLYELPEIVGQLRKS